MSGLLAAIEETAGSDTWVTMNARFTNSLGTPLVSATQNQDGEGISDIYSLAFSAVVAATSANVTVGASASNPYNGRVVAVLLDGTTVYSNVIGGIDLVFSNAGGFLATWVAAVRVGHSFGSHSAFAPDAGTPSTGRRIRVENTGAANASSCLARVLPIAKRYKKTGVVFERLRPFAPSAVEKLTGLQISPYVAAASNVTGSGAAKTFDLRIDTALVTVTNLTTLASTSSAALNVVDFYRITAGDLTDVEFKLSEATVNADFENVLIFEQRFGQIAPDTVGVPGSYDVTDVVLTEDGQSAGVITPAGVAYFWERLLVPENGNAESNPFPIDTCLQGSVEIGAGWSS